ncbi:AfsR/SARP family transcriptional regulator [Kribbella catacumbae]|uniref:AfsR/SARP family transcriptional regulator n=1 Tax=Kribbella catacumbae TaxID=460086 RepID=UPI000381C028|nr:BTAD domain-containing putative transcriptional regulator [Kribbella catacumbae]
MRFEVLGPVRVVRDGQVVGPISELRRKLLAVLLVRAGRPVPTEVLAEALWGASAPQRPGNSMQVHVHRLRQVLDSPDRLVSVSGGYQLCVQPDELDAEVFCRLHDEGRRTAESGDLDGAVALFREGLELWRGVPYADIDETEVVAPAAQRLSETRLVAYEELFDAELARGRAREIVPELTELVSEYPLRERLIGQQMLALYRSGRRTRAEVAYRAARQRLARELRAEPGRELRELGEAIQSEDPKLDLVAVAREPASARPASAAQTSGAQSRVGKVPGGQAVRPGQLPPPPGAFFGREDELDELDGADGLVLLTGMAGIGKTGLALQYAHQVADRYGDGQLYIDLCGHASGPALDPLTALGQLLRGLGVDTKQAWESVADATAEYRSVLNGRKLLVLLDNAASAEQVRPLLPATSGCLTVVTSRNKLSGLIAREGAHRIGIGELPSDTARDLLTRLLGGDRLAAEPDQATALIKACAGLPLALRIAAAQLADEPHRSLADYLTELQERGPTALALPDDEHSAVSAAFDLSYQRLDPETRQLFRRLGLVPGLDFTVDAVAALSRTTPFEARKAVRKLTSAHLLEEHSPGRYRFHDLLRDDTFRRAEAEDSTETRDDALERLYAWYHQGKVAAVSLVASIRRHPQAPSLPDAIPEIAFDDPRDAMAWVRAEVPNIAAAVKAAGDRQKHAQWTWHLTAGLLNRMADHGYLVDLHTMADSGIAAARVAGDQHALANLLAELNTMRYRFDLPVDNDLQEEALRHAEQVDHHPLLAFCLNAAAIVCQGRGDLDDAEQYLARALDLPDNDDAAIRTSLANLGLIATLRGDLGGAAQRYEQIVGLAGHDDYRCTALGLPELIRVRVMLGRLDGIDELIERADAAIIRSGNQHYAHKFRICRSIWYRDTGRHREAFDQASAAVRSAQDLGQPWICSDAHYHLGLSYLTRGEIDLARDEFERAAEFADLGRVLQQRIPAVRGLAEAELAAGKPGDAEAHAATAVELARSWRWGLVQRAEAVGTLGRVELALGRAEDAIGRGEEALSIHQRTGYFLGLARAHQLLGEAGSSPEHLREALNMFDAYGSPEAAPVRQLLRAREVRDAL